MLDIQGAVWSRLSADATLLALLASYADGPGGKGLVSDPVPDDLLVNDTKPVCIVSAPLSNEADDSFTEDLRRADVSVRLYHKPAGSSLALEQAAERVRTLIKTWPAGAITGGTLLAATVSGPVVGPTDDPSLDGRVITARLIIQET